jgi:hypothetical protein
MKLYNNMTPDEANKDGAGHGSNAGNNGTESERETTGGGAGGASRSGGSNPQEDFSEFLWMEHQEEFDEQVLKELEDEEIINFFYNLTEAENEAEAEANALQQNHVAGPATATQPQPQPRNEDGSLTDVTSRFGQLGFSSRLNPNAQEFVPQVRQQQYQSNSVPVSESGGSS